MVSVCRPRTQWHWESRRSCRMPQSSHAGRQLPSENWWTDLHCGSDWKQQTYNDGQKNYLYEDTKRKVSWFLLTNKTGLDDSAVVSSLVQISASKWVNSETAVITSCSVLVADVQCSLVMHVVLLIRFWYSCRTVFHVNCTCINSTAYHAVCVLLYVPVMIWMFNLKIKQFAVIRCIVLCVCYALIHTKKMAKNHGPATEIGGSWMVKFWQLNWITICRVYWDLSSERNWGEGARHSLGLFQDDCRNTPAITP